MATITKKAVLSAVQAAVSNAYSKISNALAAAASSQQNAAKHKAAAAQAQGKAYELRVLRRVLEQMDADNYVLSCSPKSKILTFGGSPCKPNLPQHDWISAKKGAQDFQIWVSVQFLTLSHTLKAPSSVVQQSDRHEIDIGVYRVLKGQSYPTLSQVILAASCKSGGWSKAYIREALGLRRELGYLVPKSPSLAPWYTPDVPSAPAIPVALYSNNISCVAYKSLDRLGLYVEYLK